MHTKSVLRTLLAPIGACAIALVFAGRANSASLGTEWTYQYVLSTSKSGAELQYVFSAYRWEPELGEPAMLDLLAETLLRNVNEYGYHPESLIRMTRLLRYSKSPRYASAVAVVATSAENFIHLRGDLRSWRADLLEHARAYLEEHAGTTVAQYQPGSISLDSMRENFLAARPTPKPVSNRGARLITIRAGREGATFDDVISTMGPPQYVIVGTAELAERRVGWKFVKVTVGTYTRMRDLHRMHFYYRGVGRVTFQLEKGIGWRVSHAIANPVLFEREMPAEVAATEPANSEATPSDEANSSAEPPDMTLRMHEILYGGHRGVRQAIEVRASTSFTPEVKNAAAEFLASQYAPDQGEFVEDAFEAICRMLAMQVDRARYGPLIRDIAARSRDRTISKIAASIGPAGNPAEAFEPGEVTLDEWRKRYPPLYPDSTFLGSVGDPEVESAIEGSAD